MALPLTWGATPAEVRRPYAADHLVDGTILSNILDGPRVERALRDSIAIHERLAAAAAMVSDSDVAAPRAAALAPAARALGLDSTDPTTWPAPAPTCWKWQSGVRCTSSGPSSGSRSRS